MVQLAAQWASIFCRLFLYGGVTCRKTEDFCALLFKKGMGCATGGTRYTMTEKLVCFSLMKNDLKRFCVLSRSERQVGLLPFSRRCQGEFSQREGEGRKGPALV